MSGNPGGRPKGDATVKELARAHTVEAIETLVAMLQAESERTRVAAAEALLSRGWGTPTAHVETGPPGSFARRTRCGQVARNLTTEAAQLAASWRRDPARFVREAFPWGEPGALQAEPGPDDWQQDILTTIAEGLSPQRALQIAIASGHGPGKTALVAWIILWAMLTETDTRGVVTANTESQLRTKTWAELAKWFRLCPLLTEFFVLTATTLAARDLAHAKTWRIDAVPWTENRVEAFAGLHNQGQTYFGGV